MKETSTPIFLSNTLSGRKEKFTPLKPGHVGMYHCGPTVHNRAHIGNMRSYVFADILRRMFEWNGYKVKQIINITDIGHLSSDADEGEDKMTKALKREGKPMTLAAMREIADFYFEKFLEDANALDIERADRYPFASDHIKEDLALIDVLAEKGYTYKTDDGIYFDTKKFKKYGELGGGQGDAVHSRIGINPEKRNPSDFALWKFPAPGSDLGYDSPFGKGFPGWHIECSAMSMFYLGNTFDIHTGGIDHIPVHHNNEIAQSECASGKPLANYWLHHGHITLSGEKMAKSAENFLTLDWLAEQGVSPSAYRLWLLQARYNTRLDFDLEAVKAAGNGLQKALRDLAEEIKSSKKETRGKIDEARKEEFTRAVNDDLDTPKALAIMFDFLKDSRISPADKKTTILAFDEVLGLGIESMLARYDASFPEHIQKLIKQRDEAREQKNWKKSDEVRQILEKNGIRVEDGKEKPYSWKA